MVRKKATHPRPSQGERRRAEEIFRRLKELHPDARTALRHSNPLQLLIATILSAQCTDARVNQVTPRLFARYPTVSALADAAAVELEELIHSTGFYRAKTRNILGCCRALLERHEGRVPRTMEELLALPGVGRKTANVVLGNAFGIPGVVVDTHVARLSRRLGLSRHADPQKIEQDLMARFPVEDWTLLSHLLIFHGRRVCKARKPRCAECSLSDLCPTAREELAS